MLGIGITSYADLKFLRALGIVKAFSILSLLPLSKSQLRQDLFVLLYSQQTRNKKKGGYFVEFGATNGINLSNTYLLETEFHWTGILAEPGIIWEKELKNNRPNVSIETLCVWTDSDSYLTFNEVDVPELSTIEYYSDKDNHSDVRLKGKKYEVKTISLYDLLIKYQAPKQVDYLSIDTEGSEYEILKSFKFDEFDIRIITVEHNYTPQRDLIHTLLTSNGYERKYVEVSGFDDWYVKR